MRITHCVTKPIQLVCNLVQGYAGKVMNLQRKHNEEVGHQEAHGTYTKMLRADRKMIGSERDNQSDCFLYK